MEFEEKKFTPAENDKIAQNLDKFENLKIQMYFNIFGITVGNLLLFFLIGYIIDTIFNSTPYGKVLSILIAFPVIQYLIFIRVKKMK